MKAAWWLFSWQSPECLGKGAPSYRPTPGIAWEACRSCGKDPMGVCQKLLLDGSSSCGQPSFLAQRKPPTSCANQGLGVFTLGLVAVRWVEHQRTRPPVQIQGWHGSVQRCTFLTSHGQTVEGNITQGHSRTS